MAFTSQITKIYLLRHAETDKNILKKNEQSFSEEKNSSLLFDKNCMLNHNGKLQANIVGDYFASIEHNIVAIYSSPLLRAVETADIILKHMGKDIDFNIDDRLFSGKKNKNIDESNMINDIKDLLNEIIESYKGYDVLLITHNHIFNIICKLFISKGESCKIKVSNCSMSCIEFSSDDIKTEPKVIFWNKKIKISYTLV